MLEQPEAFRDTLPCLRVHTQRSSTREPIQGSHRRYLCGSRGPAASIAKPEHIPCTSASIPATHAVALLHGEQAAGGGAATLGGEEDGEAALLRGGDGCAHRRRAAGERALVELYAL